MIARIQKSLEDKEEGFTLIELLVVVVIIGILAAIAIPTFLNQRKKAWEKAALSDLRNVAVVNEEYFSDEGQYAPDLATLEAAPYNAKVSEGVSVIVAPGTADDYCMDATHANLTSGEAYVLNSNFGVAIKVGDAYPDGTLAAAC